ncbi:peptidase S8/S53 domain-containing protein [Flagelloscypha sp. PMI_526]|nr:peptidase S8/S53 domain-containing protein [Flagelloscypha sp. PMI_526]
MLPLFVYPLGLLIFLVDPCSPALLPEHGGHNQTAVFGLRNDAPWHLRSISDCIDTGFVSVVGSFDWNPPQACKPGDGVVVYVIDAGVNAGNDEFKGTVIELLAIEKFWEACLLCDLFDDKSHGTAMASLIVGQNLGFAPYAKLVSAFDEKEVTNDEVMENISAAMDVVFENFQQIESEKRFGVINLSLRTFNGLDGAQGNLWVKKMDMANRLGLIVVLAAGNDAWNRCFDDHPNKKPVQVCPPKTHEIVVGASNEYNEVSAFSNRGSCLDLWAPGSNIKAAFQDNYSTSDGTSNSAALVSGMIAYTKSCFNVPKEKATRDFFVSQLTRNRISVREPLVSVIQKAKPWLAKLPTEVGFGLSEYRAAQMPLGSSTVFRRVHWHIAAVTSIDSDHISKQIRTGWEYNDDLLEAKTDGKGVMVYLLDSGVEFKNPDLRHTARIEAGQSLNIPGVQEWNSDPRFDSSATKHGTRMASLMLGANGGISPKAHLFPIKICGSPNDCAGMGDDYKAFMSRIYKGIHMAINHFEVAYNFDAGVISLNFPVFFERNNHEWKALIEKAAKAGLYVVPVGDNGENRCFVDLMHVDTGKTRPEKTHEFVVGASTEWNQDAVFSNRGKCVDVWAPGTHIIGTDAHGGYNSRDGTDQSSAIVTGIIAGILSKMNIDPEKPPSRDEIYEELISKQRKVDACPTCLLDAQPWLAKHAGELVYNKDK